MAPAKYKKWLEEDNLILLGAWARDGLTDEQIAHNMGISRSTLGEWKKKYSVISDTLSKNKEVVDLQVESAMLKSALGYEYVEEQLIKIKDKPGTESIKIRRLKKYAKPDVRAQMNWLMNRNPDKWRLKRYPKELEDLFNAKTEAEIELLRAEIEKLKSEIDNESKGTDEVQDFKEAIKVAAERRRLQNE